jgi:DNA-binding beta-propeller fold protein YncE
MKKILERTFFVAILILLLNACGMQTEPPPVPKSPPSPIPSTPTPAPTPSQTPDSAVMAAVACQGKPIPGSATYDPQSKAIHRVVLVSQTGEQHAWNTALPESWLAQSLDQVELVVCLEEQTESVWMSCSYNGGKSTSYKNYVLKYKIFTAKSGEKLVDEQILGSPPSNTPQSGECPAMQTFASGQTHIDIMGEKITAGDLMRSVYPLAALEASSLGWMGHAGGTADVAFSTDGKYLLTSGTDHKLTTWDPETGEALHSFTIDSDSYFALSPDGRLAATTNLFESGTINLWDVVSGQKVQTLQSDSGYITVLDISNQSVSAATQTKKIIVWDISSGDVIQSIPNTPPKNEVDFIGSVKFSPQGGLLAFYEMPTYDSSSPMQKAWVWDLQNGVLLHTVDIWAGDLVPMITGMGFSPDGKILIVRSNIETLFVETSSWSVASRWPGADGEIYFSSDGKFLASPGDTTMMILQEGNVLTTSGSSGPTVFIRDSDTGELLVSLGGRHNDFIIGLAFAPNGQKIASIGADGSIAVWDISWLP